MSDPGLTTPRDPATRYSDRVADYERYAQSLDFEELLGRMHSSSYAPLPGDPAHASVHAALRDLFDRFAENGRVAMLYDTHLYLGRLDS